MTRTTGDDRMTVVPSDDANIPIAPNGPVGRRGPQARAWRTAVVVVATIASILLVKWAFDIFLIVALFACLAFILHAGSQLVAESELLSPAGIVITLLIVGTGVWLVTPSDVLQKALHFEQFLPKSVADFLEWSAERGWAQRVLVPAGPGVGPGAETPSPLRSPGPVRPIDSPAVSPAPSRPTPSRDISVTVVAAQTTVRVGQPVSMTATVTFARPPAANASRVVRFLDGGFQIGSASLELSGTIGVASFTTTAMLIGDHAITASYRGPGLFGTVTSPRVTITVAQ